MGNASRYANRIKNGTFSIPITKEPQPDGPNVFHIPTNDHDGQSIIEDRVAAGYSPGIHIFFRPGHLTWLEFRK